MFRIPLHRVNWPTSLFLIGTALVTLTALPVYLWHYGLDWFQAVFFLVFFAATSLSITLGYHRLFSHLALRARWPVRLGTLLFGSAAFEGSALEWCSDHRRHHKHVDHDDDPYDISKGFFHAHMGWLLFKLKPEPPLDNVGDLKADRLVMWQHRYCYGIAFLMSFVLPPLLGWLWGGAHAALGSFLIAGVARIFCVQHSTFFINSMCHYIGSRPYSSQCSARDSWLMALFTFGEGYHNYHHEFQHDYRNGVKPWQFDPTKWAIWTLSKLGLASHLRRVPAEKILLSEIAEKQRRLDAHLASRSHRVCESTRHLLRSAQECLHRAAQNWEQRKQDYARATEKKIEASRERIAEMKRDLEKAGADLMAAVHAWQEARQRALAQLAAA